MHISYFVDTKHSKTWKASTWKASWSIFSCPACNCLLIKNLHMLCCFALSFTANKQKKTLIYCCLLFAIYFDFLNVFYDFSCGLNFGLYRRYFTWIKFHERNILWYFTKTIFCKKGQHLQSSWHIIGTKINPLKVIGASR